MMLSHYVCIECRKGFKKKWKTDDKCPQCGEKMYLVNTTFRIPKMSDDRQWKKISKMLRCGLTFKRWFKK